MITDDQFKRTTKDLTQLQTVVNQLLRRVSKLEIDNNRLKHKVHSHSNEIARLDRKQ